MSLLGFDSAGSATINGLTEINANNVWGDVLYYDAGTVPVNVKTAIDGITVDVTALEADVLTLQGQMTTVQGQITTLDGEVNTLQSEMNTAQSDINTLQSEMNTAQADIIALYSTTATTAATVAGLVVSQAAQDVTIASHTVSIGLLQAEDASLDGRIDALEVKTSDQSWGSLTGTTFSTKTNVGTTSAGVVLNTSAASEFGSGLIVGSGSGVTLNTATASSFSSGLKTSSVEPLAAGGNLLIGTTNPTGTINIGVLATRTGAINIGSTATGNAPITLGSNASTGQVVDIKGTYVTVGGTGTATLQFLSATSSNILFGPNLLGGGLYFGMYNPTASSATCNFNIGSLNTGTINFGTGAAAKTINLGCIAATNNILGTTTFNGITNINTTSFSNTNIGNGAAGGNFAVNAAANLISGTTNTLTSTGQTQINCAALDINATGAITIDGTSTTNITSVSDLTIQTTNPFSDILISSADANTFTSVGETEINCAALDINATGIATIDSTELLCNTTTGDMTFQAYGSLLFGATTGFWTAQSSSNFYYQGSNSYIVTYGNQTGTTYFETIVDGTGTDISLYSSNCKISIFSDVGVLLGGTADPTDIQGSTITISGTTDINTANTVATSIGNTTGALALTGSTNTILGTTNVNTTGTSSTSIGNATGTNTILGTTNINRTGSNNTSIGNTGALELDGSTYNCTTTGNQVITSSAGDVALTGTDVTITTTGTGVGEFVVRANTNVDIATTSGNIELNANTTMLLTSGGTQTIFVDGSNKMVTTNTTTTLTNTNITINPTTTIDNQIGGVAKQTITAGTVTTNPTTTIANQIGGVAKQTISSTLITNTVPTVNSGLTYPIATTTAIGYTNTTTSTTKFTNAAANLASLSIPGAGCWLVEGQWYFSGTVYTTQTFTTISLNTTSATVNTQRQQTAYQGNVGGNYAGQVTSIFNFTGAGTIYLVGLAQNTLGATSNQTNFLSITKIA